MKKPERTNKKMATFLTIIALLVLFFLLRKEPEHNITAGESKLSKIKRKLKPKREGVNKATIQTESANIQNLGKEQPKENTTPGNGTIQLTPQSPKEVLQDFKNFVELDFTLPKDFAFFNLGLEKFEGIASFNETSGILIIAARDRISTGNVIQYLQTYKSEISFLNNHHFKISGETKNLPIMANSGISKISLIPGGSSNDIFFYAAIVERADGRGTYLFLYKTKMPFEKIQPEIDNFVGSLRTKK